jgi:hypothetical protein
MHELYLFMREVMHIITTRALLYNIIITKSGTLIHRPHFTLCEKAD